MYEMLTGIKPFSASDVSSILRNVVERVPALASEVNKEVPGPIAQFVAHLFAKAPEDRFGTAAEALAELQVLRGSTPRGGPPELLPSEPGYSTVAPGWNSKAQDATTDRLVGDDTPAIAPGKRANIPTAVSVSIIGVLATAFIGAIAIIHVKTDPTPVGVITAQQHAEFVLRKQSLATARALLDAGRYDDSIRAFDTYYRMHPESVAAKEGLLAAMKASDAARSGTTVTAQATKQ